MDLPTENLFSILLETPIEDFRSICQVNSLYRNICNDDYFWQEKFARDGLPLIEKGSDWSSWLNIYLSTVDAQSYAQRLMDGLRLRKIGTPIFPYFLSVCSISANDVKDPSIFLIGLSEEEALIRSRELQNYFLQARLFYNRNRPLEEIALEKKLKKFYRRQTLFGGQYLDHESEVVEVEGISPEEARSGGEIPRIDVVRANEKGRISFEFTFYTSEGKSYVLDNVSPEDFQSIIFNLRYQGCFFRLSFPKN